MRPDTDKQLKRTLKAEPAMELPMDDAFYERMHDRIMAAVEQTEIAPEPKWQKPARVIKANWKSWLFAGGSMMMVVVAALQTPSVVSSFLDESHVVKVVRNEKAITEETLKSPENFSETLISYQTQDDFFVDVAERSFHDLSQEHVREIMGEAGPQN
jgi:hypothetical protein